MHHSGAVQAYNGFGRFAGYGAPIEAPIAVQPGARVRRGFGAWTDWLTGSTPAASQKSGPYQGGGGYAYLYDGAIGSTYVTIVAAPGGKGVGTRYAPGSATYKAIFQELQSLGWRPVAQGSTTTAPQPVGVTPASPPIASGEPSQAAKNVSWNIFDLWRKGATPEQRAAAGQQAAMAAVTYGPGIFEGIAALIGGKNDTLSALQKRLAQRQAELITTYDAKKRSALKIEIEGLQRQIAEYQGIASSYTSPMADAYNLPAAPSSGSSFPWIPVLAVALVGIVLAGGTLLLVGRRAAA